MKNIQTFYEFNFKLKWDFFLWGKFLCVRFSEIYQKFAVCMVEYRKFIFLSFFSHILSPLLFSPLFFSYFFFLLLYFLILFQFLKPSFLLSSFLLLNLSPNFSISHLIPPSLKIFLYPSSLFILIHVTFFTFLK